MVLVIATDTVIGWITVVIGIYHHITVVIDIDDLHILYVAVRRNPPIDRDQPSISRPAIGSAWVYVPFVLTEPSAGQINTQLGRFRRVINAHSASCCSELE
jgi:hypothetical protein